MLVMDHHFENQIILFLPGKRGRLLYNIFIFECIKRLHINQFLKWLPNRNHYWCKETPFGGYFWAWYGT